MVPLDPTPWPSSIEFDDLRCWVALTDELHSGRAADRLGIAPEALTETIRRLEDELALTLLCTRSREVTVTDAGRVFAEHARTLIAGLDRAVAETRRTGGLGVTLRIGCAPDVPLQRLQSFLGLLHERDPQLQAEVSHERTAEQLRRLCIGELDLGVIHHARAECGFETEPLFAGEPLAAFLSIGHPRAGKPALGPDDLTQEVLLVFPRAVDPGLADHLIDVITGAGHRFRDVRESRGGDARDVLLAAAERGCVALGPLSMPRVVGDAGALMTGHPLEPAVWMPDTALAWRASPSPELGRVIAAAREVARELHRFSAVHRGHR